MSSTPTDQARSVTTTEVVLPGVVGPEGLQIRTRELPAVAAGQALVAVEATGVSFAEQGMLRGRYPGQPKFPFVPGYDLVGTVEQVGTGVEPGLVGQRVAVLTKTTGWATYALVNAADAVPVPPEVGAAEAEAVVVNGITAWQLLHRAARVRSGQTILVHGANGGVGTILVQLALRHGVRVIGAASPRHHEALRELGVIPVDYADPAEQSAEVRRLAPGGVDAVFDNVGGETLHRSWALLGRGGVLVSYSLAEASRGTGSMAMAFVPMLAQLRWWTMLPNGRRATFYNVWTGHLVRRNRWRQEMREDLTAVLELMADGGLDPQIAARFPLMEVRQAMELAASRTVRGKIVLLP